MTLNSGSRLHGSPSTRAPSYAGLSDSDGIAWVVPSQGKRPAMSRHAALREAIAAHKAAKRVMVHHALPHEVPQSDSPTLLTAGRLFSMWCSSRINRARSAWDMPSSRASSRASATSRTSS